MQRKRFGPHAHTTLISNCARKVCRCVYAPRVMTRIARTYDVGGVRRMVLIITMMTRPVYWWGGGHEEPMGNAENPPK